MNQTQQVRFVLLNITFLVILIVLAIQYVLGMLVNLFVQFPASLPDGDAWGWSFTNTFVIPSHIIIGTVLILGALVALIVSICTQYVPEILVAIVGFAMIIYAWLNGALFLSNGQQNADSFQMALGFIGAVIAYSLGLFLERPARRIAQDGTSRDII